MALEAEADGGSETAAGAKKDGKRRLIMIGGAVGGGRGAAPGAVVGAVTGAAVGAQADGRYHYSGRYYHHRECWRHHGRLRCRYY